MPSARFNLSPQLAVLQLACILAVVAAATAAFHPVLENGFVNWGDRADLLDNPRFRGFGAENVVWMFTTIQMGHYQPLSWLTFAGDYAVSGMEPRGFHRTSLILHIATAIAVFFLLQRLIRLAVVEASVAAIMVAAAIGTALFAVHPLRVETVAWATERRGSLSGLFYVLAAIFYLRYAARCRARSPERNSVGRDYLFSIACFLLSMLAKEFGISLPVVLLILDIYPLRRLGWAPGRLIGADVWPIWREKWPFFAIALVGCGIAALSSVQSGVAMAWTDFGPANRIAQSCFGLVFYLVKSVRPEGLSPLYAIPVSMKPFARRYLVCAGIVVMLTIALFLVRKKLPAGLAAWSCYVVILFPVLGLVQTGRQMAADRYTYLPAIVLSAVVSGLLARVFRAGRSPGSAFALCTFSAALFALPIVQLVRMSREQSVRWKDSATLWRHALDVDPDSSVAHNNLGEVFTTERNYVDAAAHFRRAIEVDPNFADAYSNYGVALAEQGRLTDAIDQWHAALKADPKHVAAASNLARAEQLRSRSER